MRVHAHWGMTLPLGKHSPFFFNFCTYRVPARLRPRNGHAIGDAGGELQAARRRPCACSEVATGLEPTRMGPGGGSAPTSSHGVMAIRSYGSTAGRFDERWGTAPLGKALRRGGLTSEYRPVYTPPRSCRGVGDAGGETRSRSKAPHRRAPPPWSRRA